MNNEQVSEILYQMADLLERTGEERFKVVAYQKATRAVGHLCSQLSELGDRHESEKVPGVGMSIAAKIQEMHDTGHLRQYEELRAELPKGVLRIADVPGIGPKSAHLICQELGVSTIEGIEKTVVQGRVEELPRMGKRPARTSSATSMPCAPRTDASPLARRGLSPRPPAPSSAPTSAMSPRAAAFAVSRKPMATSTSSATSPGA